MAAHFLLQDFDGALAWINKIISNKNAQKRIDIQDCARLLQLIVLFELYGAGDHNYLENRIKAAGSIFRNSKELRVFERIVLRFFKRLINAADASGRIRIYSKMRDALTVLRNSDNINRFALGLVNSRIGLKASSVRAVFAMCIANETTCSAALSVVGYRRLTGSRAALISIIRVTPSFR